MRLRACLLASFATILLADLSLGDEPKAPEPKGTFWVIPHTHWEGAVFKTREEYLDMGLANILKAMRLLREQPGFRFTLDQVAYVRPFLERFPNEEADFRRFLAEGRLQLAGALDVMPDDNMPGGETFVRQMIYGKGYYRDKLGVDVTTGWQLDTFGHHAQMPQLMTLGGYKSFWFFRGVPRKDFPSEFLWEGIDGTRIDAYWMPQSYAVAFPTPKDLASFTRATKARFDILAPNSPGILDRAGPSGADVSEPEEHLVPLVEAFNKDPNRPFTIKVAVPADFEAVTARRADRTVFKGELNPDLPGDLQQPDRAQGVDADDRASVARGGEARRAGGLAGQARRSGRDPRRLGARPLQPDARPGLGRHDRPRLRGHDPELRILPEPVGRPDRRELGRPRLEDRYPRAGHADRRLQPPGLDPLGHRRGRGRIRRGGRQRGRADRPRTASQCRRRSSRRPAIADGGLKTDRFAFIARDVPALGYATYHAVPRRRSGAERPRSRGWPRPRPSTSWRTTSIA